MNMKGIISISTMVVWLIAGLANEVVAQKVTEFAEQEENTDIEREKSDYTEAEKELILTPGMNPYVLGEITRDPPERFIQTGAFVNNYGIGVQSTYRFSNSRYFGQLFMSGFSNPGERISNANNIVWGGATFGVETLITRIGGSTYGREILRADSDGIQIYARVGPGIGIMGYSTVDQSSFNTHYGIHSTGTVGAITNLFRRGSLYVEGTAFMGYFPTLNEMRMVAGPQLTIGFTLFGGTQQPMYRY